MSNKFSAEPVFWKILTCFFEHLLDSNFPVALTTHWGHTRVHYRPVYIGRLQWDKPLESTNEKSRNIHSQTVNPEISITLICVKQIERTGTCSFCIICKQSLIYDPGFEHRCLQWVCTTLLNNYNYRYTLLYCHFSLLHPTHCNYIKWQIYCNSYGNTIHVLTGTYFKCLITVTLYGY